MTVHYADLRGRKKSMLIGLVIFAVASATCGLATDSLMLNLSRAAQGVGDAFLLTASLAILSNAFTSRLYRFHRVRARLWPDQ